MTNLRQFMEDEGTLWREMTRRVALLERKALDDVPVGTVLSYPVPARSPEWSHDRETSIGDNWNHRYRLNQINAPVKDATGNDAFNGVMHPSTDASHQPKLAQPGILSSEGSYSVYFDGSTTGGEKSCITTPLMTTQQRDWTLEAIFVADVIPQTSGFIAYNGTPGSDGWGMAIGDGSGGSGSHLAYRSAAVEWLDTGVVVFPNIPYHVVFIGNPVTNNLHWHVGVLNPKTKVFTYVNGNTPMALPNTPSASACIGAQNSTTGGFQGWIDEVAYNDAQIPGSGVRKGAEDRVRVGLETAPPVGYLKTDGTLVSRTYWARLFSVLGESQGAGDGSTTFELPTVSDSIIKT
jgi:hypothetical protein